MKNISLIILIFIYIHLEAVHMQFSKQKYSYNFFAPVAHAFNTSLPKHLKILTITEVSQTEDIWWYARDLVIYIKAFFFCIIALIAYNIKNPSIWISLMFLTVILFSFKEISDYVLFKNIFSMYDDNKIATGFILVFSGGYAYDQCVRNKRI
jgi:hypothetical protein